MRLRFLADTNVLSELVRPVPHIKVRAKLLSASLHETLAASEISRMELRFGTALRENGPELWRKIETGILSKTRVLPVNEAISLTAGDLQAVLQNSGQPIGLADSLIAATALAHDLTLVTRNTRHFERVPNLRIENWFEDMRPEK